MKLKRRMFFSIVRICCLFIVGLVAAFIVALSQINLESLRGNVVAILQEATGVPVEIDGAVSWKLSLRPQVELNQVRVPNADWAKCKDAFNADKIDVTLNLISLFRDRPTIQNVKIYDAKVCLEENETGQYSITPFANVKKSVDENVVKNPDKYPFKDPGLGGVEVKKLSAKIFGHRYSVAGFNVRHIPKKSGPEYSGWIKSDEDVFPFIVSLSEYNAQRKVYPVRVAFATGGDALIANVALEGTSKAPIDFIIKGDVPNPEAFGAILNWNLDDVPQLKVNLAGGFDRKKITLRKSSIALRGTEFTIAGEYDWSKKNPQIYFSMDAGDVVLAELLPNLYGNKWSRPNRKLNVFKNVPLFGDVLFDKNIHMDLSVDKLVVYRDLAIKDIDLIAKLKDNHARLDLKASIGDGDVELGADVEIAPDGMLDVKMGGIGERIYIGEILKQVHKTDFLSELPLNAELYVEANGKDLSDLMKTVTGPVYVYSVAAGYAHSALVAYMYGTDFLTSLRHGIQDLFRTEKKHNQIKISCVALNAKLRDGVFETQNGFAIETNAINIRLAGNLDLGDETMRLSLTTVPVRGLKLSLVGNVVNSIELTGSLAEPDIKISGAAMAGKVASATGIGLLLAPLTGGLSIVAGAGVGLIAGDLLENWLADDHPCETAMKRGAPDIPDDPEWMAKPMAELVNGILIDGE